MQVFTYRLLCCLSWLFLASVAAAQSVVLHDGLAYVQARGAHAVYPVQLPYDWDKQHPGTDGELSLEMPFAHNTADQEAYAIALHRVGNAYELWLNGSLLSSQSSLLRSQAVDSAVSPRLHSIPRSLLQSDNLLRIVLRADAGRHAGLSSVLLGPEHALRAVYLSEYRWRVAGRLVAAALSAAVALMALVLWLTQPGPALLGRQRRDALYGWMGVAQILWAFAIAQPLLAQDWLPWAQWQRLAWLAYAASIACLLVVSWQMWRAASASVWQFWRMRWMALAWLANGIAAVHDAWLLHSGLDWTGAAPWLPYSGVLFGLTVVLIAVARFRADSQQVQDLLHNLSDRVAQHEAQLRANYAHIETSARAAARDEERAQVLRDMHDGVGAHLGSALRQIDSGVGAPVVLQTLRNSLDRLKLSIDAMQCAPGDVGAVLANLRYRLAPRMAAANTTLDWHPASCAPLERLSMAHTLQLQHTLFDALVLATLSVQKQCISVQTQDIDAGQTLEIRLQFAVQNDSSPAQLLDWQTRMAQLGAQLLCELPAQQCLLRWLLPRQLPS